MAAGGSSESRVRSAAADRLTMFTDAVLAIAMTLLALDLPVPEGDTNAELLRSAAGDFDDYLAFLVSFVVIAAHWRGHSGLFRYVNSLGGVLGHATMWWLFMQVITPYATRVLTGDGAFQARFCFYAGVQAAAGLLFLVMTNEVRRLRLYRVDTPTRILTDASRGGIAFVAAFLVSMPLSFVTPWAYACWAVVPLAPNIIDRVRHRSR